MSSHFGKVSKNVMERWKVKRQKCCFGKFRAVGGHITLFGTWDTSSFFHKILLQCTTRYGNTISFKISEKSNGWLFGNSPDTQPDGWTDAHH